MSSARRVNTCRNILNEPVIMVSTQMDHLDSVAYEQWRQWQERRLAISDRLLQETLGPQWKPKPVPLYEEWIASGRPDEARIKTALETFFGYVFGIYQNLLRIQ
jgi:uncharacterized protein YaeQ